MADDLNSHNDAYPLARPSQAAALATLLHEDKVQARLEKLRTWTEQLANDLRALGVRTYKTQTYFFVADFAPLVATDLAERLRKRGVLIKALNDPQLGPGFMRVTTALPEDNRRFVQILKEIMH
jgi:histidinol-phosphate aminotransferase